MDSVKFGKERHQWSLEGKGSNELEFEVSLPSWRALSLDINLRCTPVFVDQLGLWTREESWRFTREMRLTFLGGEAQDFTCM